MTKKLYKWNWVGGGYNQCHAVNKAQALKKAQAIGAACKGTKLVVNEATFVLVKDVDAFWKNYPLFD